VGLLTREEFEAMKAVKSTDAGQLTVVKWLSDLGAATNLTGISAAGAVTL
jgi:hypothetical protein